jgi:hypothetical protein
MKIPQAAQTVDLAQNNPQYECIVCGEVESIEKYCTVHWITDGYYAGEPLGKLEGDSFVGVHRHCAEMELFSSEPWLNLLESEAVTEILFSLQEAIMKSDKVKFRELLNEHRDQLHHAMAGNASLLERYVAVLNVSD